MAVYINLLYATFMRYTTILILTIVGCNTSDLQTQQSIPKSIHIPDTTNNWYAKNFDYSNYVKKTEISKQLNLENLESDSSNTEIRIWTIFSTLNPQTIILLKNKNNICTVTRFKYFLRFDNDKPKVDSVSTEGRVEKVISLNDYNLLGTEQIWQLPSQSEIKNGGSYGCLDGYALLIEMNNQSKYKFLSYICPDLHISKDTTFKTIQVFVQRINNLIEQND